jgi:hypothetical protein
MGLLRLLTNPKVMGEDVLTPGEAIGVYGELLQDARVRYVGQPAEAEGRWFSLMTVPDANGSVWTEA